MQCRVLGHQQFSSLSLTVGNIDPPHSQWLMVMGHHPSLTGAGADKSLQQVDMVSQQSGQPEPHLKVQPPCSGTRDDLNCLR